MGHRVPGRVGIIFWASIRLIQSALSSARMYWQMSYYSLYEIPLHDYPINAAIDESKSGLCVDVMSNTFDEHTTEC